MSATSTLIYESLQEELAQGDVRLNIMRQVLWRENGCSESFVMSEIAAPNMARSSKERKIMAQVEKWK